jgi:hypothetical protein
MQQSGQSAPISPAHQKIIDEVLQRTYAHIHTLAPVLGYGAVPALSPEQIKATPLAKELRIIARYAEGYDLGVGNIEGNITNVTRLLFASPLGTQEPQFPRDFHVSPLGEMIHAALCRQYPRSERMEVREATRQLRVSRQTIHEWAHDGTLLPIYDKGNLTLIRRQVERLAAQRAKSDTK